MARPCTSRKPTQIQIETREACKSRKHAKQKSTGSIKTLEGIAHQQPWVFEPFKFCGVARLFVHRLAWHPNGGLVSDPCFGARSGQVEMKGQGKVNTHPGAGGVRVLTRVKNARCLTRSNTATVGHIIDMMCQRWAQEFSVDAVRGAWGCWPQPTCVGDAYGIYSSGLTFFGRRPRLA